jgi:hypothetical protein
MNRSLVLRDNIEQAIDHLEHAVGRQRVYAAGFKTADWGKTVSIIVATEESHRADVARMAKAEPLFRESAVARAVGLRWCMDRWGYEETVGESPPGGSWLTWISRVKGVDALLNRWPDVPIGCFDGTPFDLRRAYRAFTRWSPPSAGAVLSAEVFDADERVAEALEQVSPETIVSLLSRSITGKDESLPWFACPAELVYAVNKRVKDDVATYAPMVMSLLERDFKKHHALGEVFKWRSAASIGHDERLLARLQRLVGKTKDLQLAGALTNFGWPSPAWDSRGRLTNVKAFLGPRAPRRSRP